MDEGQPAFSPSRPIALYIHVPFCLSICPYCDFVVYGGAAARGARSRVDALVDALETEIGLRARAACDQVGVGRPRLASIYLGGGTPSLLSARQVARLLTAAADGFGLVANAEVSLEANPGAADRGDLAGFRAAGVNRLSIGAQSMVPAELQRLGRRHAPTDVAQTVAEARRAGYENISLDLLYDVPGQTLASWRRSLDAALRLEPDHVSAYALALDDPDTEGLTGRTGDHLPLRPGARHWRERAKPEQDEDRAAACYELADQLLERAGLGWYELSNWSRPGKRPQPDLLAARAARGRRARCPRIRRRLHPPLERRPARRLPGRSVPRRRLGAPTPPGRQRNHRRNNGDGRTGDPRPPNSGWPAGVVGWLTGREVGPCVGSSAWPADDRPATNSADDGRPPAVERAVPSADARTGDRSRLNRSHSLREMAFASPHHVRVGRPRHEADTGRWNAARLDGYLTACRPANCPGRQRYDRRSSPRG
jgi:hypothetical protein